MSAAAPRAHAAPFEWNEAKPQDAGFAPDLAQRIDAAIAQGKLPGLHGLVVLRHGRLVVERYQPGEDMSWNVKLGRIDFAPATLHDLRSVTKSITALLYGIALAKGLVPAPEAPLMAQFPEYPDLAADESRRHLTIAHVLGMTMGMDWDERSVPYTNPANSEIAMELAADCYRFVLERRVVGPAGERWTYSGGATALLGALIARGSGKPLPDFAREVLFEPLGITRFEWLKGRDGTPSAASGLRLTPRDLARIGLLVLQKGKWQQGQVVSQAWLEAILQPRMPIEGPLQFGWHWYIVATPAGTLVNASGNGGQRLFLLPAKELLIVTTFGNYDRPEQRLGPQIVLNELVLPALLG